MTIPASISVAGRGALLVGLLLAGCKKPAPEDVLARVGSREIRVEEFAAHLRARQGNSPVPLDSKQLLNELVDREIFVQQARKAGLESDREVQEQIRDILIAKLKERTLTPELAAATVSDAEISKSYESRRAEFTRPERAHLAVLFLPSPAEGSQAAAARQRLETAQGRVRQVSLGGVANFGPLAVDFSDDQETRYRGGDLGWVEKGRSPQRIEPAVIDAGFALKEPGALSEVIRGARGFYLVKLIAREGPAVAPLASVEPAIRAQLLREKREAIEAQSLKKLREAVAVEVHPERLPTGATPALPPKLP